MRQIAVMVRAIDRLNDLTGRTIAWATLGIVIVTFLVVLLRYLFALGWVWMQESYVWLHGITFMLGAGYTLLHGGHVRVDIFYHAKDSRFRALVDLFGAVFLLMPFAAVAFFESWGYVLSSWRELEGSREAGGLPALYLLKTVIWLFCLLLALQGLALAGRAVLVLAGQEQLAPKPVSDGA